MKIILSAYDKSGREITLKGRLSLPEGAKILTDNGWETLMDRVSLNHSSEWNSLTQSVDKKTWIEGASIEAPKTPAYVPTLKSAEDAEFDRRAKARDEENRAKNAAMQADRRAFSESIAAGIASGKLTAKWIWTREEGNVFDKDGKIVATMHQSYNDVSSSKDAWTVGTKHHVGATVTGFVYAKA